MKEVAPSTLQEGDVIAYISQNTENFGETVTHKIRRITKDAEGNPGFVTYGTTTNIDDETIVTFPYVLGKYRSRVPGLGRFFSFLKTTPGYFVCIFVPFMLLITYEGVRFFALFRRYKREQMEQMEAERTKLQEERTANAKMLESTAGKLKRRCLGNGRQIKKVRIRYGLVFYWLVYWRRFWIPCLRGFDSIKGGRCHARGTGEKRKKQCLR